MRAVAAFWLFALVGASRADDVRVYIAPRSAAIPSSGKVVFDVYWVNDSQRSAAIPPLERYSFTSTGLPPHADAGSTNAILVDHPSPDRIIKPRSTLHEHVTSEIDAQASNTVIVDATFHGSRSKFRSNTIVLYKRAKKT